MRLFIGVFPPKETLDVLRDYLRLYSGHKRNLKFPPVDQMHITLKYIGSNVSENSYEIIKDYLVNDKRELEPLEIKIKSLKFGFKFDSFPRVLMAQVESTDAIFEASDYFHNCIKDLKLKDTIRIKGRFSNTFHITLARLKETASRSTGKTIKNFTEALTKYNETSFITSEAYLVESIIRPGKPVIYKKLELLKF